MGAWKVAIDLGSEEGPAFLRIARAISDDIRRGRLRAGDALPGSRTLADSLGVHRNTVLAAYRELEAEGWLASERARGTFVAPEIPERSPRRFSAKAAVAREVAARPGFDLPLDQEGGATARLTELLARATRIPDRRSGAMTLGGGVPDVRLVPTAELARAVRRVLRTRAASVLAYGDPAGPSPLRLALARMVAATRGVAAQEEHVLVARGSQMGIDLVARVLLSPGDIVAVEARGYPPAWESLRAGGAHLVPVGVDAQGVDVDAIEELARKGKLRAVYVTPHHQYPTTVTLAAGRRLRLLELAREHRFFLLEDDYDHEFHYEGRPVLPLASADVHGVVVYLGTLSKVLAPGLRIGFVVAPPPIITRLSATRRIVDRQGDHMLEHAVAEMIEDGALQRHIRRTRRIYAERRRHLAALLTSELGDALSFDLPSGGTAIWTRVRESISADTWAERAWNEQALVVQTAKQLSFDGAKSPFFRLGFAQHEEREAREAVRRLKAAMPVRDRASPQARSSRRRSPG